MFFNINNMSVQKYFLGDEFIDMWQYLVTFFTSCFCAALAEYGVQRNHKHIFRFFSALAILLGALLAGVRASSVGTDVMVYGNSIFMTAYDTDILTLFSLFAPNIEPLYILLNFLISRITNDVHVFYFFLQFITLLFVYISLCNNKGSGPIWLGLLTYYTLFYSFSLNGMRQAVAMAIVLYATKYIYSFNLKKYIIFIFIAMGFHYTAILFLLLYPLYYLISNRKQLYIRVIIVGGMLLIAVGFRMVLQIISIILPKYSRYLLFGTYSFSINPFLIRIPVILLLFLLYNLYSKKEKRLDFWIIMLIGDIIFSQLRSIISALYRVSLYMGLLKVNVYPLVEKAFNKKSRLIVNTGLIVFLVTIWYYQTVIQGNEGVYPYTSDVIPWLN